MVQFEFPLLWLKQQPRTKNPKKAQFGNHSPSSAGDYLSRELEMLGAKNCIISSNLNIRLKGDGFYANQKVNDCGIVVYFKLKGKDKAMACDKWDKPEHNIWALYLSVSAIRGLERWGGSEFLDGLFTGFTALPSPENVSMNAVQYFSDCTNKEQARERYLVLSKELHPDLNNGVDVEFKEVNRQYQDFMR